MNNAKKEISKGPNYSLDVRLGKQAARRFIVKGRVTLGKSSECDIKIDGLGLAPLHMAFNVQAGILSVTHLAKSFSLALDKQELEYGRSYILDKGDKISVDDVEITIRKDEVLTARKEEEQEDSEDEIQLETLQVDSKITPKKNDKTVKTDIGALSLEAQDEEHSKDVDGVKSKNISIEVKEKKQSITGLFKKAELSEDQDNDDEIDDNDDDNKEEELSKVIKQTKNKKSFFARLFKKNSKPKLKNKKRFFSKNYSTPVGIAPRFYSLLLDGALIYALKYFAVPFFELGDIIAQYINKLIPILDSWQIKGVAILNEEIQKNKIPIEVPKNLSVFIKDEFLRVDFISIFLYFAAVQLVFHILTGSSLGLYLMGAKSSDGLIKSRIKAVIKCLIGFVTLPFLIFDFPLLFGKRSFKEFITFSDVEIKGKIQKLFSAFVLIPIIILACFASPVFFSMEDLDGFLINKTFITHKPLGEDEIATFSVRLPPTSMFFKGHLFNNLKKTEQKDAPPFVLIDYSPKGVSLNIFDQTNSKSLQINITNELKIRPLIQYLDDGDPLFSVINSKSSNLTENEVTLSDIESQAEILELIEDSFKLSAENFPEHLIKYGPFINGTLKFRRKIFELLEMKRPSEIGLYKIAGHDYISLVKTDNPIEFKTYYINLDLTHLNSYHFIFSYKGADSAWANNIITRFFKTLKIPSKKDEMNSEKNALEIEFDFMFKIYSLAKPKNLDNLTDFYISNDEISTWMKELKKEGKVILETEDKGSLAAFKKRSNSMLEAAQAITTTDYKNLKKSLNTKKPTHFDLDKFKPQLDLIKKLILNMTELNEAIKNKNLAYFEA